MVTKLLKRAIEQKNAFMPIEMIQLQVEFFYTAGKINDDDYAELNNLILPEETLVETPSED